MLQPLSSDPISDSEQPPLTPESARVWRNINRFGARCFSAGIAEPYVQVMDALLLAFEKEPSPIQGVVECRLLVACDWMIHGAASPLLLWAQENIGYRDVPVEDRQSYFPGGSLYQDGPQTMYLRRWGFWMQRFEEFSKMDRLSEEVKGQASKAVERMKTVEARIGHTLLANSVPHRSSG